MKKAFKKVLASLLAALIFLSAASVNGFTVKSFAADTAIVESTGVQISDGLTAESNAVTSEAAAEDSEVSEVTNGFMVLLITFVNVIIRFCESVYNLIKSYM